jgi:glycosyltransferase involved in cell wall biosynthesis
MHILHIVGSYGGTDVYKNLYTHLDKLGVQQTIFVPLNARNHARLNQQLINFSVRNSTIIYSTVLKSYHRVLYRLKIAKIVRTIKELIDVSNISVIHAATLCMDGAVAYELWKKYNIPYVVAMRNTDISSYYKYFKWEKSYFAKIFAKASTIVFICPRYRTLYFEKYVSKQNFDSLYLKTVIIPNGIDELFWNNRKTEVRKMHNPIRVVFASAFVRGKGLLETIQAIATLHNEGFKIELRAIGKGLPFRKIDHEYIDKVERFSQKYEWVVVQEYLPKKELRRAFSESDVLVMPSKPETFGLVYVEALSQNLPIVYTKDEGFDGYFEDGLVGYPVEAFNVDDIVEKLKLIIKHYEVISSQINDINLQEHFSWNKIAEKYFSLYRNVISITNSKNK